MNSKPERKLLREACELAARKFTELYPEPEFLFSEERIPHESIGLYSKEGPEWRWRWELRGAHVCVTLSLHYGPKGLQPWVSVHRWKTGEGAVVCPDGGVDTYTHNYDHRPVKTIVNLMLRLLEEAWPQVEIRRPFEPLPPRRTDRMPTPKQRAVLQTLRDEGPLRFEELEDKTGIKRRGLLVIKDAIRSYLWAEYAYTPGSGVRFQIALYGREALGEDITDQLKTPEGAVLWDDEEVGHD